MVDTEDGNERRRQITLHSFRRFVKSTISDLGYGDYSEWFIGHSGSTYWRKKESEKVVLLHSSTNATVFSIASQQQTSPTISAPTKVVYTA